MDNKNAQSNTNSEINLDNLNGNIGQNGVDVRLRGDDTQESAIGKLNSNVKGFEVDLRRTWNATISNMYSHSWRHNNLLIFLMILFGLVWFLFFRYDKYIVDYSNWIENTNNKISNTYEKVKKNVYDLIWLEYK